MKIEEVLRQVDELYGQNKGGEAEQLMLEAVREAVAIEENEGLLQLLNELLGYYRETSQVEHSYAVAGQALALAEKMGLSGSIPYATTLLNVANAYRAGGRLPDSLDCYKKVREIYEKTLSPDNMLVASLENNLSLLYQEMGDFENARKSLLCALEIVSAREAEFEVAVTYANLASTCLQLGEAKEAREYALKAMEGFEALGVSDAHYGAALAAMGNYHYARQEYAEALDYFVQARDIMEQNLGRNEYYDRLQEYVSACQERTGQKRDREGVKGLALCREYYETYGKPMIETLFPEYVHRIAVGLVGEGSDCFGFDDEISRDHDWGPGFCMWVTDETYEEIGEKLQEAYEKLPAEFNGYKRSVSARGAGRRGVMTVEAFYRRLLPVTEGDGMPDSVDWRLVTDASLAACVNGEVFRDDEGAFTAIRNKLLQGYPEEILFQKLAESCARFSQTGQYNYQRCLQRGDTLTARMMLVDCAREAMKLKLYLAGQYPPHDKWLHKSVCQLPGGTAVADCFEKIFARDVLNGHDTNEASACVEKAAELLVHEMYEKHYISDTDPYLDAHTEELLVKASLAGCSDEELTDKIARLEFSAFDKVKNQGGRASCQNDWPTFYVMRKSQYLTFTRTMLLQYYYDFQRELSRGHNLIEEKYGRMMESTAPAEYEKIKHYFPELSKEKQAIIEQIVALQVAWMEEFATQYPNLADNARSVRTAEDNLYNTSYETYLRGEISTYSDKMLELYGRYIVNYAEENKNPAYVIMGNSAWIYGYDSLDKAEQAMKTVY